MVGDQKLGPDQRADKDLICWSLEVSVLKKHDIIYTHKIKNKIGFAIEIPRI